MLNLRRRLLVRATVAITFLIGVTSPIFSQDLPPEISSVTPNSGLGYQVVTIDGDNFVKDQTEVFFGAFKAIAVYVVNSARLLAIVPTPRKQDDDLPEDKPELYDDNESLLEGMEQSNLQQQPSMVSQETLLLADIKSVPQSFTVGELRSIFPKTLPVKVKTPYGEDILLPGFTYPSDNPGYDSAPPTITYIYPEDGSVIGDARPNITATFQDSGLGVDFRTISLKVDGQDVTDQSQITLNDVTYTPSEEDAFAFDSSHTVTLNLSDTRGNAAEQVSSSFTVAPMLFLYIDFPTNDLYVNETPITVYGFIQHDGLQDLTVNGVTATIDEERFSASIPVLEGENTIEAIATDNYDRQTIHSISVILDTVAPVITIISPTDAAVVDSPSVTVEGTLSGSSTLDKVIVNKNVMAVKPAPFVWWAYDVPLSVGSNIIEATAIDKAGNETTTSVTVQTNTQTEAVSLDASVKSGTNPLLVTITPVPIKPDITDYYYYCQGDQGGTIDFSSTNPDSFPCSYNEIGLYYPTVVVRTSGGLLFSDQIEVNVHEPITIDNEELVSGYPVDIEVDATGLIYVLFRSPANLKIYSFDTQISSFILQTTVDGSSWSSPEGFDLDDDLNIFIADTGNNKIHKLIPTGGNYQLDISFGTGGSIGTIGAGEGEFDSPFDVAVDEMGMIFVSDKNNHRIQKFDSEGNFVLEFGSLGSLEGELNAPKGITYSYLRRLEILVADSGNDRIQIFDQYGNFVKAFGSSGTGQGQLQAPSNISEDRTFGQLLVADQANNRVQIFDEEGQYFQELDGLGLLNPQVVAADRQLDAKRYAYILDTGNSSFVTVDIPQISNPTEALTPYYALISALQANDIDAAVATFVKSKQIEMRLFYEMFLINDEEGLVPFGEAMALDSEPVLLWSKTDSALYVVLCEDSGEYIEFELEVIKEDGQWKILDF